MSNTTTKQETGLNLLVNMFQPYKIPANVVLDGDRFPKLHLGTCSIQLDSVVYSNCNFFQITKLEISNCSETEAVDETLLLDGNKRFDIIFTLNRLDAPGIQFYSFPREALTECLTKAAPHKVIFSFLPLACVCYTSTLEEFAAVCADNCKSKHINNIIISNVSNELLQAIKQTVNDFEFMCQNMLDLMRLHNEKVTGLRSEIHIIQSEEANHDTCSEEYNKSKDEEMELVVVEEEEEEEVVVVTEEISITKSKSKINRISNNTPIKKCLYCGSKSTPMWRRGPQGAGTLCNACGVKWKHGKILNGSDTTGNYKKNEKKKKTSNKRSTNNNKKKAHQDDDEFVVPAPPQQQHQQQQHQHQKWDDGTNSSSSISNSPLDSFTCSPNTSPSNMLDKRDLTSLYDTESLSVYVGEDAVEAAALLTLLKRS